MAKKAAPKSPQSPPKKSPPKKSPPKKSPPKTVAPKKAAAKKLLTGKKLLAGKKRLAMPAAASLPALSQPDPTAATVLDRLHAVVLSRRATDPALSHSARLLSRGVAKVAQKFGEEAVECLIEAVAGNRAALVGESADVLYHLLVMWVAAGVEPAEVWAELERREGVSGLVEKAGRAQVMRVAGAARTTKIP